LPNPASKLLVSLDGQSVTNYFNGIQFVISPPWGEVAVSAAVGVRARCRSLNSIDSEGQETTSSVSRFVGTLAIVSHVANLRRSDADDGVENGFLYRR
jgi:hypothetical protein